MLTIDQSSQIERAVLVHVDFNSAESEQLAEFVSLVESTELAVTEVITVSRHVPDAKFFIGSGKVEEIAQVVAREKACYVIFNHALTPSQQRNLEKSLMVSVLDRTQLILDIFAQRARTHEGKLQVELAQLQHLSTRLIRGWTHLERQKGGIGLRGPGETQLETDRRLIRERIKAIKARLLKVRKQREQGRQQRKRKPVPVVAIVGYTNAGKSTLFNRLTSAEVYAADQLFATLDPTLRRIHIAELGEVILADTVGFIRDLPHQLVDAFRATLEETCSADLLLHVVDSSVDDYQETIAAVDEVLMEIGADKIPQIKVFNKIDLQPQLTARKQDNALWLSATSCEGLSWVADMIKTHLQIQFVEKEVTLLPQQANLRAKLYALNAILHDEFTQDGKWHLQVRLPQVEWQRIQKALHAGQ